MVNKIEETQNQTQGGNQQAIDRYLNQILEAKRVYNDPNVAGTARSQAGASSNQARAQLDALGYTGHNDGYMASGTSYDTAMQGHMMDGWRKQGDAQYAQQEAQINASISNQINAIERAMAEAVAQGQLSEADAQRQFEANREQIMKSAYRDSQVTKLGASNLGISNSQQLMGLQAGDNARRNTNETTARGNRDARINEIKTRISQLSTQRDLDVANINTQRDQALIGARAQIDNNIFGQMANFQASNYQADRQHGRDLDKMGIQQKYNLETMDVNHKYQLNLMAEQYGMDIKKMDKQHLYVLDQMGAQHGYDMSKIGAQHSNQMKQISEQAKKQSDAIDAQYEKERQRVADSYKPGTPEYGIRINQLEEARTNAINGIHQEVMYGAMNEFFKPGTPHYSTWMQDPGKIMADPAYYINQATNGSNNTFSNSGGAGASGSSKSSGLSDWLNKSNQHLINPSMMNGFGY